jgi:hypothetical protein
MVFGLALFLGAESSSSSLLSLMLKPSRERVDVGSDEEEVFGRTKSNAPAALAASAADPSLALDFGRRPGVCSLSSLTAAPEVVMPSLALRFGMKRSAAL